MNSNAHRITSILLLVAGLFSLLPSVCANTPIFVYTNRDLLLCFRKAGANGGTTSPNDLEINIGQASIYYGAAPGSTVTLNQFTSEQLAAAFDNLNDLSWSVGGCVPVGDTGDPGVPVKTLWVTAPRTMSQSIQSAPWVRNSPSTQGLTSGRMNTILANAAFYSGTVSADPNGNATNIIAVPVGGGHEYAFYMGPLGNYNNTFQGNVENTTPSTFTSGSDPVRSDLYELRPDSSATQPPGKYLGYFELRTNGTVVFVAASNLPPAPNLSISVSNNTSTISFDTVQGATYSLSYTNAAGLSAPFSTWAAAPTNITGDGLTHSFEDKSTDANRFYRVVIH